MDVISLYERQFIVSAEHCNSDIVGDGPNYGDIGLYALECVADNMSWSRAYTRYHQQRYTHTHTYILLY